MADKTLQRTVLHGLHEQLGAKMVPFAGYEMPVQYPLGVMKEHLHCRASAGLFDVSHMGQILVTPKSGDLGAACQELEGLLPQDILGLKEGRQRYGFFTNDAGGIEDDLIVANRGDHLFLVVNAACKEADFARLQAGLPGCDVVWADRALLALQGPAAETVLAGLSQKAASMRFMDVAVLPSDFGDLWVSRSGYTGEDGFEISVSLDRAEALAEALLADPAVEPIGLGARDSLRLEAGLCLYGSDIDAETSPVEADLVWGLQKARKPGGAREGGFPGADRILRELAEGASRKRVILVPEERAPMRAGTEIFAEETGGAAIGAVTSGAFGPSHGGPVAMGYVAVDFATPGARLFGEVRGKRLPVQVAGAPVHTGNYKR